MRGDFSRRLFDPSKHYTSVLQQQGRVALDADANEQCAIDEYIRDTEVQDIVGPFGGPRDHAGFEIKTDGNTIWFSAGRYYVDGILCENETSLQYASQPYLLNPDPTDVELLTEARRGAIPAIQVYLEVWQRLVTVLDDPCLREPALGLADTTGRLQTVWRVVARASTSQQDPCCSMTWADPPAPQGKLAAQTSGATGDCSCQPFPSTGYFGLENQLYRIEIQKSGDDGAAGFKWSRENGSVVAAITGVSGNVVQVDSLGPDANLGFASGQWVEISDDKDVFGQNPVPGSLYQIDKVIPEQNALRMTKPVSAVDTSKNARARRWDQFGATADVTGVRLSAETWLPLENGIQLKFGKGFYQAGDYWLIAARTASGQIEWPPCGSDGALQQPAIRPKIVRAPLACISWSKPKRQFVVKDCRQLFDALVDLSPPAIPDAIHVTAISWNNDDVVGLDTLYANGLTITLDRQPDINTTNLDPVFEVKLEAPTFAGFLSDFAVSPVSTLRAKVNLQPSGTHAQLSWTVPREFGNVAQRFIEFLDGLLPGGTSGVAFFSLLAIVRVKLVGRLISLGSGSKQIFLDGQVFGTPDVRADGSTPRINLQLPSGDSQKASDFEGWFYLAPLPAITALTVAPAAVNVVPAVGGPVTVVDHNNPSGGAVHPQGSLILNYPLSAQTTIMLSVVATGNAPAVVSVPPNVTLKKGAVNATFPITVEANPGIAQPSYTYQIVASLARAAGNPSTQTANFQIFGAAPIIF